MFISGSALGFSLSVHLGLKLGSWSSSVLLQSQNTENGILTLLPSCSWITKQLRLCSLWAQHDALCHKLPFHSRAFKALWCFLKVLTCLPSGTISLFIFCTASSWEAPPSRTSSHRFDSDAVITTTVVKTKCHPVTGFAVTKSAEVLYNFCLGHCQESKLLSKNG